MTSVLGRVEMQIGLAEQGWEVVAVEPSKLRELAKKSSHSRVTWIDDSLPSLAQLRSLGNTFANGNESACFEFCASC